jgi:hypothetical protein
MFVKPEILSIIHDGKKPLDFTESRVSLFFFLFLLGEISVSESESVSIYIENSILEGNPWILQYVQRSFQAIILEQPFRNVAHASQ